MRYQEIQPAPILRPYVRCYWTLEAPPGGPGSDAQRVLPDGCVEIVINLGDRFVRRDDVGRVERQPRVLLVGPTTRHMSIAPTGSIRLIGIRFAPGGAFPFLSISPREVRDAAPALDDVAPPIESSVLEQIATASDGRAAAVLDAALGSRLASARRVTDRRVLASVRETYRAEIPFRVDALVALTGLGARQIERTFRETMGFGPKTLCRLVRFQRVVRAVEVTEQPKWARIAAQYGYADQSHLARDFHEFAGTTLTAYLRELHPMSDHFHANPLDEHVA